MSVSGSLTQTDIWKSLQKHYDEIKDQHMRDWFATDPNRFERFHAEAAGLSLDFSKNRINEDTMHLLMRLAQERNLPA